ncbi:T-box transcription factor TBX20-like protein [Leptotrombidium deliense]|uniref:T-box transcription factor TBX20-like protein n=1 Tax=Leptotrombidium deliense TaxID=299467 RepID=A0A443SS62_9ACAR|nr:T-box transcription factor TBX20-like protein [Leptotrombidium deliense]
MLITTHLDLVASGLRNQRISSASSPPSQSNKSDVNMQNHRTLQSNSSVTKQAVGPSLQSRPATDFSIEAIMGRNSDDRPSPKIAVTAEIPQSPKCSVTTPRSPGESCDGSRSPTNSEITAGSIEGDIARPRSSSPVRSTPSPSNSNCSTKESNNASSSGPNPFAEALKPRCNCEELSRVDCHLENKDLWDKFNELGTEMIITKSGRRMFPTVRVSFSGIELDCRYIVLLDIVPVDNKRYRYAYHRSSWLVAGKADPPSPARLYVHPDAPFSGDQLRKQVVSFEKVKLTNNEMDKQGHVSTLASLPIFANCTEFDASLSATYPSGHSEGPEHRKHSHQRSRSRALPKFRFSRDYFYSSDRISKPTGQFVQQSITKLKIDSNPFAKGFRDSSRLTDLERETMENLMSDSCGYPRSPMIPPFLLNGDDPTSILLRERAALLGIHGGQAPSPNIPRAPVMWRPHPAFSQLNPNELYSLLAATTSCPPWYSALGAHLRGPPPPPPSSVAALAFTASSQFWSNPQISAGLCALTVLISAASKMSIFDVYKS